MGSTYHKLLYHWICSTKHRRPFIRAERRPRFLEYLGGTIRGLHGVALKTGGVEDHVHLLLGLKPVHCISDFVREFKKASSAWAARVLEPDFEWQEGYSIFSVGSGGLVELTEYIEGQEEHHRKETFEAELKRLLEKHGIQYDPQHLL